MNIAHQRGRGLPLTHQRRLLGAFQPKNYNSRWLGKLGEATESKKKLRKEGEKAGRQGRVKAN